MAVTNARAVALCVLTVAIHCVTPDHAWAQCGSGYVGVKLEMNRPDVSAVFSGTAAEIQALDAVLLITFDVDGIWKGDVEKRAFVYRPIYKAPVQKPGSGGIVAGGGSPTPFEIGKRYVIMAHILSDQERTEFRVESAKPGSLAVSVCGSGSRPFEVFALYDLKEMGPSRKPQ
jgi:hypothetical protein